MNKVWIVEQGDRWDGGGSPLMVTLSFVKAGRYALAYVKEHGYVKVGKHYWKHPTYGGDYLVLYDHPLE